MSLNIASLFKDAQGNINFDHVIPLRKNVDEIADYLQVDKKYLFEDTSSYINRFFYLYYMFRLKEII